MDRWTAGDLPAIQHAKLPKHRACACLVSLALVNYQHHPGGWHTYQPCIHEVVVCRQRHVLEPQPGNRPQRNGDDCYDQQDDSNGIVGLGATRRQVHALRRVPKIRHLLSHLNPRLVHSTLLLSDVVPAGFETRRGKACSNHMGS